MSKKKLILKCLKKKVKYRTENKLEIMSFENLVSPSASFLDGVRESYLTGYYYLPESRKALCFKTLETAITEANKYPGCGGITFETRRKYTLRKGRKTKPLTNMNHKDLAVASWVKNKNYTNDLPDYEEREEVPKYTPPNDLPKFIYVDLSSGLKIRCNKTYANDDVIYMNKLYRKIFNADGSESEKYGYNDDGSVFEFEDDEE